MDILYNNECCLINGLQQPRSTVSMFNEKSWLFPAKLFFIKPYNTEDIEKYIQSIVDFVVEDNKKYFNLYRLEQQISDITAVRWHEYKNRILDFKNYDRVNIDNKIHYIVKAYNDIPPEISENAYCVHFLFSEEDMKEYEKSKKFFNKLYNFFF